MQFRMSVCRAVGRSFAGRSAYAEVCLQEVLSAGSLQFAVGCRAVQLIRWLCSSKRCRLKLPTEFQMQKQQRCQGAG